jgi:hypothetical protein
MTPGNSHKDDRDHRIAYEAESLWRELYGHAPPAQARPGDILELALRGLEPKSYERLQSPYLRRPGTSWPIRD